MKHSSITHCLVSFLDFIPSHLDKQDTSLAVAFVDFSKAFDLVVHTVAITKAIELGLHPNIVSWLTDFLSVRQQIVRSQGSVSPPLQMTCGVPQDTKIGPLCFLVLINNSLMDTPHRWKYVDDSTLGVPVNNRDPDYAPLQASLDNLQAWTVDNSATINHTKTVVMQVCTSKRDVPPPLLSIGSHHLQVVQSTKLLCITVNNLLNWKLHVSNTVRAASYKLYMLRRLRTLGASAAELCSIYTSFILPKLMYASPARSSSLTLTQQQQLERVQKRAFRVILGPDYHTYDIALTTLNLPRLSDRHQDALSKFGISLLHHPRHRHLLPPDAPSPIRFTRHHNILTPFRAPRTDRYKRSAVPAIVQMINNVQQ